MCTVSEGGPQIQRRLSPDQRSAPSASLAEFTLARPAFSGTGYSLCAVLFDFFGPKNERPVGVPAALAWGMEGYWA